MSCGCLHLGLTRSPVPCAPLKWKKFNSKSEAAVWRSQLGRFPAPISVFLLRNSFQHSPVSPFPDLAPEIKRIILTSAAVQTRAKGCYLRRSGSNILSSPLLRCTFFVMHQDNSFILIPAGKRGRRRGTRRSPSCVNHNPTHTPAWLSGSLAPSVPFRGREGRHVIAQRDD